jgi:hypothetical protein
MIEKLHQVDPGNPEVEKIVKEMLDMSLLTPSKIPLIQQKRMKRVLDESE